MTDLDPLVAIYLGSKQLRPTSRQAYQADLELFTRWCQQRELSLTDVTTDDYARYALHLDQTHENPRTAHARRANVRRFYTWLHKNGKVPLNPVQTIDPAVDRTLARVPTLSVTEVRRLIEAATAPMDAAMLVMSAVLGMPIREINAARVRDLVKEQGEWHLNIPTRPVTQALPDYVARPLVRAAGERTRGYLVLNTRGRQLTRGNQRAMLNRLATSANLGIHVSAAMLVSTLRSEAMIFAPTLTAYQGLGPGAGKDLLLRARSARPSKPSFASLAASHFRPDSETTDAVLDASEALGGLSRLPTAARVAVAGSAFERHLRELAYAERLLDRAAARPTSLGQLQGVLRRAGVFTNEEVQACATVQEARDWAAHGWYEQITEEAADRALHIMRRLTRAHPVPPDARPDFK